MAKMIKEQLAKQAVVVRSLMVEITNLADRMPGLVSRVVKVDEHAAESVDRAYNSLLVAVRELEYHPSKLPFSGTHLRLLRRLRTSTDQGEWLYPRKAHNWTEMENDVARDLIRLRFVKSHRNCWAFKISKRGERFLDEHDMKKRVKP